MREGYSFIILIIRKSPLNAKKRKESWEALEDLYEQGIFLKSLHQVQYIR